MILAIILMTGWAMIGRLVFRLVYREETLIVELAIGAILGNIFITYGLFSIGWWEPHSLITYGLTLLAGLGVLIGWPRPIKIDRFWTAIFLTAASFFVGLYLYIWQQNTFGITLRMRGVWGDWGHHIGLPLYYQFLNRSSLISPFTAGFNFTYSFLNALIPTALLHLGTSLRFAILVPGIIWSVALWIILIALGKAWDLKKISLLTPILLFISGNLGFTKLYFDLQNSNEELIKFLTHLPREYGHWWEGGYHVGNFLDFFFVSQRSYLLGMSVGLIIILLLIRNLSKKTRLFSGILLGLLPLIHMHTFISLSVILGIWTLLNFRDWKQSLIFWLPAAIIATPYFWWLYRTNAMLSTGNFLTWKSGWLMGSENWIWFWIKNVPIIIPGIIGGFMVAPKLRGMVVGAWIVFILLNLIQFQPNLADNNKLIVWWYLLAGIYPTLLLLQRFGKWWLTVVVIIIITFSGWLQLIWIGQNAWDFASREDLAIAEFAKGTCIDKRWLTHDRHNHPVFTFAGRPLVLGYRGWLWTWGINYTQIETDVRQMYTNPKENTQLFSKYNISYAVVGPTEIQEYHPDVQIWHKLYPIVYHTSEYLIFAVNPCLNVN